MTVVGLLPHQADFLDDVTNRRLGMVGGVGCGKTHAVAFKALQLADINWPHVGAVIEPTYVMMREVLMPTFHEVLSGWGIEYNHNKRDSYLEAFYNGREHTILLKNSTNYLRLAGLNLAWAIFDEAEQHPEEAAKQVAARIRVKAPHLQFCAVGTPEGVGGWFHRWFELERQESTNLIRAKTTDNHHLPADFIKINLGHYSEQEIRRYVNGEFVAMQGVVYTQFSRDVHVRPYTSWQQGEYALFCDFGGRIQAWGLAEIIGGKVVHVCSEQVLENTDTISAGRQAKRWLAETLSDFMGEAIDEDSATQLVTVYCDPAGGELYKSSASDVRILQDMGFRVLHRPRHPRVKDRVNAVQHKLAERELYFDEDTAPYITRCVSNQIYDETTGAPKKWRPRDGARGLDHGVDALGYLVEYEWPAALGGATQTGYH